MRIISGKYKSRRIPVAKNLKARPTTDFARESLMNILNNVLDFEDVNALDLFSGTGSVALELVSRGCPHVVSVELDQLHYTFICKAKNILDATELIPIKANVFNYLKSSTEKFDLIFADPPYTMEEIETIPDIIFEKQILNEDGIFILEHSKRHDFSANPHFENMRVYGNVHFSFFK